MAFCTNCGAQLDAADKFCPHCGTPAAASACPCAAQENPAAEPQTVPAESAPAAGTQANAAPQQPTYTAQANTQPPQYIQPASQPAQQAGPADKTGEYDPQDIYKNNIFAVLAYLSWLVIIPLLAAKDSKYARFHTNQGLVLAIGGTALGVVRAIVLGILNAIVYAISYRLSFIVSIVGFIFTLVGIGLGVLSIMGIIYAATGKAKELPVIGKIHILK